MVGNGRFGDGIWDDICDGILYFIQMYDFGQIRSIWPPQNVLTYAASFSMSSDIA
jgi:hypothetical protein